MLSNLSKVEAKSKNWHLVQKGATSFGVYIAYGLKILKVKTEYNDRNLKNFCLLLKCRSKK